MSGALLEQRLREQLGSWVAQGLITAEQAARIEAAETAAGGHPRAAIETGWAAVGTASAPAPPESFVPPLTTPSAVAAQRPAGARRPPGRPAAAARRVPLAIEALGYLGGLLAFVAGFIALRQLWPDITTTAELVFAAAAAAVLLAGGAAVQTERDPAFARLCSVLWVLSTACLAAFSGLLAAEVWDLGPASAVLVVSCVAAGYALVLWLRTGSALQHLALFAAVAVVVGSAIARIDVDLVPWGPGVAVWLLSAGWGVAGYRGYLRPRTTACLAAAVGLLVGAQLTMQTAAGNVLGLVSVAAILAAGVALRRIWLVGIGAYGLVQVVPQVAVRYLPDSVGAPLALFVVGVLLLGIALWLARSRSRGGLNREAVRSDRPAAQRAAHDRVDSSVENEPEVADDPQRAR